MRSPSIRAGLALRARIVLLAADGIGTNEIARRTGVSKPTVIVWRKRYAAEGIGGLEDRPRPGQPRTYRRCGGRAGDAGAAAGAAGGDALVEPAAGAPSWASPTSRWRTSGVSGACSRGGAESFKFSTDPQLEAKIRDVVGLYLNPPEKAVVVCVDEKSQIQALDRTAPMLPMRPGTPEKGSHDYIRHGTTTLFAALEVATGKVTDACYPRHRHQEFLQVPAAGRQGLPAAQAAHRLRQLRHPQAPRRPGLAGQEPADHPALHADIGVLAEHRGDLLRHHHPPGHPPRHLHLGQRPDRRASRPSSTAGTTAASPSPGPRPPTRSSRNSRPGQRTSFTRH